MNLSDTRFDASPGTSNQRLNMSQLIHSSASRMPHMTHSYVEAPSDLLAMSVLEKQKSAMQIDLSSKQNLIEGQ